MNATENALLALIYLVFLAGTCGFAVVSGGRTERIGAAIMVAASLLSWPAQIIVGSYWNAPEYGVFAIDLMVLAALLALALRSNRFWPIWATSFQTIAVATHLATMVDRSIVPMAYAIAAPFWAYPTLLALAFGTRAVNRMPND